MDGSFMILIYSSAHALDLIETVIRNGGLQGKGLPIGNLTGHFLANVYLDPLDHFVRERPGGQLYLRYMDDYVLFSDDRQYLKLMRKEIEEFLEQRLRLRLKENVVTINQRMHGLSFVGARIFPKLIRIRRESLRRSLRRLRMRMNEERHGRISPERFRDSVVSIVGHLSSFDSFRLRCSIFGQASQAPTA